jgi:solute carrier family 25 phosphate transporter 3
MLQLTTRRLPILAAIAWLTSSIAGTQVHATSAGAAALSALRDMDLRYFVAGGTCAAFSHGITTPIDVVKTRIQADPKRYSKGIIAATSDIIETEGASALLSGLGPTVVGYGVEGAMKFGVYEVSKPILKDLLSSASKNRDPLAFILASIFAGALAALLLCPMESLRIRQVTDESFAHDSIMTGIPKLVKQDGILSLFGAVLAMLSKQVSTEEGNR